MPALDVHYRPPARFYAFLLCVAVVVPAAIANTPGEVPVGAILRAANMQGLNGPSQNLSAFHGRPLLINVWASWCGPCKSEMASLERLAWRDRDQYFAIIGISTDDDADQARALLKKTNATISHFIDRGLQMENMLGASKLPLTVLVDADGRVLEKIYGTRQWDSADALRLIERAFHRPSSSVKSSRISINNLRNPDFSWALTAAILSWYTSKRISVTCADRHQRLRASISRLHVHQTEIRLCRMLQIVLRNIDARETAADEICARRCDHESDVVRRQHARNVAVTDRPVFAGGIERTFGGHDGLLKAIERFEILRGRRSNDDGLHSGPSI